jgi:mannose/cellobiose epimerase-like protein (N-acyl-D-glucosamine 2-epimerase family)
MIYRFRSKATGDTVMLGPDGDRLLRLIGREPAPQGIIEAAAMPAAIAALQQAALEDTAQRSESAETAPETASQDGVSLQQRVWPMVEMLRAAHAAEEPIVWGV